MTKYSQYDEQEHILAAFEPWLRYGPQPRGGRFLDIGAYNPFEFSNTRALFEMGWTGVMIEPSPGPMCSLIHAYGHEPRIILLSAAVGLMETPNPCTLHVTDDCTSTTQEADYQKWKARCKFNGLLLVPVITLEEIGEQFPGFDFINFDAEGVSADLCLNAIVELGWRPHCVCCEHDGRALDIEADLLCCGYSKVYENGTNIVLVRNA